MVGKQETSEEREERRRKREREIRVDWSPLPRVQKTVPMERTWPIMCARERAFLRGTLRLAEGGRRRHVDESRAAGKPSHLVEISRKREEETRRLSREKRRKRRAKTETRCTKCSRAFGYLYIFCFQPTRVSACLRAVPGSTFLRYAEHSSPVRPLSFATRFSSFLLVYRREDGRRTNS